MRRHSFSGSTKLPTYVALLRAVNVGGTGKLPMAELKAMCEAAGFAAVRTYIASGNVVFESRGTERAVKAAIETRLAAYAGKPVGVLVRTAAEMAEIVRTNPFPEAPGNRVVTIFLDTAVTQAALDGMTGRADDELICLGKREITVFHGPGVGVTRLRIPAAKAGTARNMNTVERLAAMAAA